METTVFISFNHCLDHKEYDTLEGAARVLNLIKEGYPIRRSYYDKESKTYFIRFGCKNSTIIEED